MICKNCKKNISQKSEFCKYCGNKIKKDKLSIISKIFIFPYIFVMFVIFILMFVFPFVNQNNNSLTKEKFINYMKNNKCNLVNVLDKEKYDGVDFYYVTNKPCPYLASYTIFENPKMQNAFYNSLVNDVKNNSNTRNSREISMLNYFEVSTYGENFKLAASKNNEVFYISVKNQNTDKAVKVAKEFGFYFEESPLGNKLTYIFIIMLVLILMISWWKINIKMGRKGWICLIPIYNILCLSKDVFGSYKYFIIYLIPLFNIYSIHITCYNLGKVFKKSENYLIGLVLCFPLFVSMLAFDDSKYIVEKK